MKKFISVLCMILTIMLIVLGFISPFIIQEYIKIDGLKLNEVTTWITVCMSAFFSLASIFLVILNLTVNSEKEQRNNERDRISQFQNRFFKLYAIFDSIRNRFPKNYLESIIKELDCKLKKIDYTVLASDSLRDIGDDTCRCYADILESEKNELGEYISCLNQLMLFVECEDIVTDEKKFCMNFLGASLSKTEKKILFYHVMNNSEGKRFHDIIEEYDILWNIDKNSIVEYEKVSWYFEKRIYDI